MVSSLILATTITDRLLAQELTIARTVYAPIPDTEPILYIQNDYAATWLTRISKSNSDTLNKLQVTLEHNLPIPIPSETTLFRLCELGARDPDVAWPIFQAFWAEITAEGRPPILMTMDSLQYAMQESQYRSASFELIHAHDLAIIKHFIDYLSGEKTLPNGGAIIAATQRSHANINKMVDLRIQQAEDQQELRKRTHQDPYEKAYDQRAANALTSIEVLRLQGLSKTEARGLMEYWAQSGVLRTVVDERVVAEKWALAGNGIVGEIERGALTMRI
jgi:small subunit ribosomal protein S29